jgi:hypothetical protein
VRPNLRIQAAFVALLVGGGLFLGGRVVRAQGGSSGVALDCYEGAQQRAVLNNQLAVALCSGAQNMAPLECFLAGNESGSLSQNELVILCRCTQDLAPIECFERAQEGSMLSIQLAVSLCSPSVQQSLLTNCVPLSGTPPQPAP